MADEDPLNRWITLHNARGIAGAGARETEEEKSIVERDVISEFVDTARELLAIEIADIRHQQPPLPDFPARVSGEPLCFELTEFIDPKLLKQSKHIKKNPDSPINDDSLTGGLWFDTDQDWFFGLLRQTIKKKELRYQNRETKIDVLVVWNEALQVGIEDTDRWLQEFKLPELASISSIYFQSWYHPHYIARPTWSVKAHPLIGNIKPKPVDP